MRLSTWPTFEWSWASDTFGNAATKLPSERRGKRPGPYPQRFGRREGKSANVPDGKSATKQNALVRLGTRRDMVAPGVGRRDADPRRNHQGRQTARFVLTAVMMSRGRRFSEWAASTSRKPITANHGSYTHTGRAC